MECIYIYIYDIYVLHYLVSFLSYSVVKCCGIIGIDPQKISSEKAERERICLYRQTGQTDRNTIIDLPLKEWWMDMYQR
jgi:hypothetical protein